MEGNVPAAVLRLFILVAIPFIEKADR